MQSGIVLIDKPKGITSHDVVSKVRKLLGTKKVGHAGTLDPMATGLLLLGFNSSTRLLHFLVGLEKQYVATFRLGANTSTDDAEGEIISEADATGISIESLDSAIADLTGEIEQVPSSVSAIKVDGKRAYDLARAGEEVTLKSRQVTVSKFERTCEPRVVGNYLDFDAVVDCSSGTYIRALARDLGKALGVGGHLTALRRTKIGKFEIEQANDLGAMELKTIAANEVAEKIFPVVKLSVEQARDIVHGKRIKLEAGQQTLAVLDPAGELLAILELTSAGDYKSLAVFPREHS